MRTLLVLTYWAYDDALIQTYTLPYLRMIAHNLGPGGKILLVTLERKDAIPRTIPVGGVVHLPFLYRSFGPGGFIMVLGMLFRLLAIIILSRVDVIHAWCTPAGAIGHVLSVLTGRPLVIDSYEPHAEAMVENGTWRRSGLAFRILFAMERAQSRRARHLIAATHGMAGYACASYAVCNRAMFVKPACVDLVRFSDRNIERPGLRRELGLEGKLIAVYAGKFGGIYLDQEVFDLFRVAMDHWGPRFHVLLLTGHTPAELAPFMARAGLPPDMFTIRFVPHHDMPDHLGLADFAITPVKSVPTKRYCTPIKDGEYWALGLPIVITQDISDDSDIIREHGIGSVLEGLDQASYKKAVLEIDELLGRYSRMERYARIRPVAERYRSFDRAEQVYTRIYGNAE